MTAPQASPVTQGQAALQYEIDRIREARRLCPYCTSDIREVRAIYFDQCCPGCVKRMGVKSEAA